MFLQESGKDEIGPESPSSGGNVNAAIGVKDGTRIPYLQRLEYDKFEKRVFAKAGNGVVTTYDYRPDNRRLKHLTSGAEPFQDLTYNYDSVGNITALANDVSLPRAGEYGGPVSQQFRYDALDRLTAAEGPGAWPPTAGPSTSWTSNTIRSTTSPPRPSAKCAIAPPARASSRRVPPTTGTTVTKVPSPTPPPASGMRTFDYDASGNQLGWETDQNGTRRTIDWDGANRIQAISDNGRTSRYAYDDQGQRVLKAGPGGRIATINRYYSVRNGAIATKHVSAGDLQIVFAWLRFAGVLILGQERPKSPESRGLSGRYREGVR